jgi:transposase
MTIDNELEAKILRYHHVEKWRVGTIAAQLHVHHSTVRRVLMRSGVPKSALSKRSSMLDQFFGFIQQILEKFPKLTASRLYQMVYERGYRGGPDHFRHLIAEHRPRKTAEAYLRLRTLPGEQAQVDWGHFGYVTIGRARRPVMAFVMVLSFSRKLFLRFYLNQQMANFLRGHEAAFQSFGGVARVILYDNLKSAVLERQGDAIRFNPELLEFAAHYRFEPRPVAVARGNEKGRVERAIRYIRDNFFAARTWVDMDDLNRQAQEWCEGPAATRLCPEDTSTSVQAVFLGEKEKLIALPDNPWPTDERCEVSSGKTPYVRFDLNDYSIPHTLIQRPLTLIGKPERVIICNGSDMIADHPRSYDRGQQIEKEEHIQELTARKRQAREHRGQNRLTRAIPCAQAFLSKAAEHQYNIGSVIAQLLKLVDRYGASELEAAMQDAMTAGSPHPNTVRISLERRREQKNLPPPIPILLPDDARVREITVRPHSLETYTQLQISAEESRHNDN